MGTNRNRLSQQESENEIKMFALTGDIEQETRRAELLKVLQSHKLMEAKNEGEAEAERVKAFLESTASTVPSTPEWDSGMCFASKMRCRQSHRAQRASTSPQVTSTCRSRPRRATTCLTRETEGPQWNARRRKATRDMKRVLGVELGVARPRAGEVNRRESET